MFGNKPMSGYFLRNSGKIKAILLLIAFFSIISPFTGLLELQSNLVIFFNDNFAGISKFPSELNPIFFIIEYMMYEINLLFEFLIPNLWGTENYIFLRFLFKLPLLFFFILNAILIEKIITNEFNDNRLASNAFYIQLFNIPLIFTTFFLGTWESIAIFFLLLNYYILLEQKKEKEKNNFFSFEVLIAGFLFGIAITFSYFLLLGIFLFIQLIKLRKIILYCISAIFSFILINIPVFYFGSQRINFTPNQFGMSVLLTFFHLEKIFIYSILVELILLIFLSQIKFLRFFDKLSIFSTLVIFFSINFTFNDFVIFFQIFLLGILKFSDFKLKSKTNFEIRGYLSDIKIIYSIFLFYILFIIYALFVYQTSNIIYLRLINVSFIETWNRLFWNSGLLLEFKSYFFIIFSIQLFLTAIFLIQKRKIFNITKRGLKQDSINS